MRVGERAGLAPAEMGLRDYVGDALLEMCRSNPRIVVLDGDLANSTGVSRVRSEMPDRFYNIGIAESNLVCVAAGLASNGFIPALSSFSSFLFGNAYDQIRLSIELPHLNVKLLGSHAGITISRQGPQSMSIEDFALSGGLPGCMILVPSDPGLARKAVSAAFETEGLVYIRYSKESFPHVYSEHDAPFTLGKANTVREGKDVTLIACGLMVAVSLDAAAVLNEEGISARVIDMHTLRPFDTEAVERAARETRAIVTAEEHLIRGGLGSLVAQVAAETFPVPMRFVGIRETPGSGSMAELMEQLGITAEDVVRSARQVIAAKTE